MAANPPTRSGIPELLWLFFSPRGRISRSTYWLAIAVLFCTAFVFRGVLLETVIVEAADGGQFATVQLRDAGLAQFLVTFPLEWCSIMLVAKRCRDRGWSGFVALLSLLPIVNIILTVYIGLVPGDSGANQYGTTTDRPPTS